ncbi:amidase [Opitutus sp. GAS368]|uniref:amidase n=1 Tax=Opitutus sp. GAS368 TaxID=1882749 RepID=UPI00087BCB7B|nr:amidase [Opitutus sp. GAS368]SDS62675.1 amidase/aspartyl-tRNA(Asn)/glutamyl-tRNA(Gln) amidotransferase subunit A [Opitutus sp. GAS368]
MSAAEAAHTVHARIAALPEKLRAAALAWLRPERELAEELEMFGPVGGALRPDGIAATPTESGRKAPPTIEQTLHGVPYLLKDLFDLAGVPTKAGSAFLDRARGTPTRDSVIALRLRELGAACAGKTHLVEFAAGLFGDNSHYGDCPHPHFPDRLSGGSSSGSAALVAAGVVPLAVGTDTGGSVRVPAAFCGLYGFRLSPRDDFIRDAMPLAPSLDTAGWFTANAADMLTTWEALVPRRVAASRRTGPATSADPTFNTKEPRGCFLPAKSLGLSFDPDTAAACDRAAAGLAKPADAATAGALKSAWADAIEAYTVTALSEAHAVHRDWLAPYHEHYEASIWQRFSDGGRYPAEQLAKAAATFETVRAAFRQFFASYDYLVLPATPFPALRKADCTPEARKALLTLTTPASLGGLPVLSIPVSLPSGLTTGLQIVLPAADSPVVPWICSGGL